MAESIFAAFRVILVVIAIVGYVSATLALYRCAQLSHRVAELERRAAWFMPPGQEHPEPVEER